MFIIYRCGGNTDRYRAGSNNDITCIQHLNIAFVIGHFNFRADKDLSDAGDGCNTVVFKQPRYATGQLRDDLILASQHGGYINVGLFYRYPVHR